MLFTVLTFVVFLAGASVVSALGWCGLHLWKGAHFVSAFGYIEAVFVAFGLYAAIVVVITLTIGVIELLRDWQSELRRDDLAFRAPAGINEFRKRA